MTLGDHTSAAAVWWRRHRLDLLFGTLFAGLAALNVWPFWAVHWLAGTDTGGHIELMDIAGRLHDPSTAYSTTYYLGSWIAPNTVGVRLSQALHPWLSTMTLARLMLSFYVVGVPLGCLAITRAFDRSRWLVLLSFPLVFNYTLAMGFFNYVVALPLLLVSVAMTRTFAQRGGWLRAVGLVLLLWLAFFTHALVFLVALGMCAFVLVVSPPGWRRLAQGAGIFALASSFCALWFAMKLGVVGSEEGLMHHAVAGTIWPDPERLLTRLPGMMVDFVRGPTDDALFLGLVTVWLLLRLSSPPRREDVQEPPLGFRLTIGRDALAWMALLVLVAFFTLPSHVVGISLVSERFASLALVFALLTPRLRLDSYWTRGALALGVALCAVWTSYIGHVLQRFDVETAQPLAAQIASLPDGSFLGYALANDMPTRLTQPQTRHLVKELHIVLNGGITDDSFAFRPTAPVQYRSGQTPPRPYGAFWTRRAQYEKYDFIVYSGLQAPPLNPLRGWVRERWHGGVWWLYEVIPVEPVALRPGGTPAQRVPAPATPVRAGTVRPPPLRLGQSPTAQRAKNPTTRSHDASVNSLGR